MAKYYTRLSKKELELIKCEVELSRTELEKLRSQVDAKPSDTFSQVVRQLIKQKTSISKVKYLKG